jgi:hypothetical protein
MSRRDIPRWCLRLTSELDAADARAIALGKGLTVSQLNWTVRPDVWSVGQCLEHLCIANEVYVGPMTRALVDDNRATGSVEEINPGWFGRWFIREYIDPATQKKRYRAPKKTARIAKHVELSILDRFIASNARVRDVIALARDYDVNRVRFRNPFVPLVRFTIGTGLQIITLHNHRHLGQAERVKHSPEFRSAS